MRPPRREATMRPPAPSKMEARTPEGSEAGAWTKRAAGGTLTGGNEAKRARRSGSGAAAGATAEGATRKGGLCPRQRERSMQGVRGGEHLRAPARKEHMQGVRGGEHLPAPAQKEPMQGVRGGEHLPAPAPEDQLQGLPSASHRGWR